MHVQIARIDVHHTLTNWSRCTSTPQRPVTLNRSTLQCLTVQLKARGSLHSQEIRGRISSTRGRRRGRKEGREGDKGTERRATGLCVFSRDMTWICWIKSRENFKTNFSKGALKSHLRIRGLQCAAERVNGQHSTLSQRFQLYIQESTGVAAHTSTPLRATLWSSENVSLVVEDFYLLPDNGLQR